MTHSSTPGRGGLKLLGLALISLSLLVPLLQPSAAGANGVAFQPGNVLAGTGSASVKLYTSSGTLRDTLVDNTGAAYTTGMCFDSSHNLYVTDFSETMSKYDDEGNILISPVPASFPGGHPESCTVDASDNIYTGGPSTASIEKLNTAGELLETYPVEGAGRTGGTDWVDLAANGCTIYYTGEGSVIDRYNVCTKEQEAQFASGLPGPCFALRIRPKTGEVLVACEKEVVRLDSSGKTVQTYAVDPKNVLVLFALNLDPDGTSFWTGDIETGEVYHVDIASGTVINEFNSEPASQLAGLAVVGEIEVARPQITLTPAAAENPVGTTHTVTATVTENGEPQEGVTVSFTVSGANPTTGEGTTNGKGEASFTYEGQKAGEDSIVASFKDKAGKTDTSNTATKKWVGEEEEEPSCTFAKGVGHLGMRGTTGLNEDNEISVTGKPHVFKLKETGLTVGLTKVLTAQCIAIPGGFEFSGTGLAKENKNSGYKETFAISEDETGIYLTAIVEKEGVVVLNINHQKLKKASKQKFS